MVLVIDLTHYYAWDLQQINIYEFMNFSKQIQVKPLAPHKKGEEVMRVHVIYASAVSPAAPERGPRQSWDLEVTSPASFHEVS